jgi:hypothetical protein
VNSQHRSSRIASLLAVGGLALAACGGSTESSLATDVTTTVSDTVVPATEASAPETTEPPAPETTVAPAPETTEPPAPETTEAPAPPSSAAPVPVAPVLLPAGIGPFSFGAATLGELDGYLAPLLGMPVAMTPMDYPLDAGGYFENPSEEVGFAFPSGSTVCYSNQLCTDFGGPDAVSLTFVGYRQNQAPGSLATASGVTAGSAGADFPSAIAAEAGGCFSIGGGTADGVGVVLQSSGTLFTEYNEATEEYINQVPPLGELTVLVVLAGEQPFDLFGDC